MYSGGVVVAVPAQSVVHAVGDVVGVARGEAVVEALAQRSSVADGACSADPPPVLSGDVVIVVPNCKHTKITVTLLFAVTPLGGDFVSAVRKLVNYITRLSCYRQRT